MQGAGGLIGETRGGTTKYYHADALGTTRAITNSAQTKTDSLDTDAFGMNVAVTGTTPTPFGFAGQHGYQNDSVTGLMRLGHRYYDASVGRFLSRDPIQDGYNWYAYCNNDPVNHVDPEGLAIGVDDAIVIYWIVGGIIVVGGIVLNYIHDHWNDLPTIQWPVFSSPPGPPPQRDPQGQPLPPNTDINWEKPGFHDGHYDIYIPAPEGKSEWRYYPGNPSNPWEEKEKSIKRRERREENDRNKREKEERRVRDGGKPKP